MKDLQFVVSSGNLLRNLHRWSAHAMVILVFAHKKGGDRHVHAEEEEKHQQNNENESANPDPVACDAELLRDGVSLLESPSPLMLTLKYGITANAVNTRPGTRTPAMIGGLADRRGPLDLDSPELRRPQ